MTRPPAPLRRDNSRFGARRRGQALVELALFVPVLLLFLSAVIEFGRLHQQSTLAAGAAREGARVAATGGKDTEVAAAVGRFASALDPAAVRVAVTPSTRVSGQEVTVTVDVPVTLMTPVVSSLVGPVFTVHGKAVMRVE
jgi:Flp pilus assembly protein TadG